VDATGHARITDFSLATIGPVPNSPTGTPDDHGYTRWTAPEILWYGSPVTKQSDIFAFGMVIIEVGGDQSSICQPSYLLMKAFTGKVPFNEKGAPEAIRCIMVGEHPKRPSHSGFTGPLWALTQKCWKEAQHRPSTQKVIDELNRLSAAIIYTTNTLLTHSHRSANQATEILPSLPEEPSTYRMPPETSTYGTPAETDVDMHGVATPYDVDTHQPGLASSRQSWNAGGMTLNLPSLLA